MIETLNLAPYDKELARALAGLAAHRVIPRIWEKDWTVWKTDPAEVGNRLGWLKSPQAMPAQLPRFRGLAATARRAGCGKALVLGMGGSSLAPLVMASVFETGQGGLDLDVLDSTDPAAVLRAQKRHASRKTLFIVSSKSGTTVETSSFFSYFWNAAVLAVGPEEAPGHFAVITDPGTPLAALARQLGIGNVFHGDPEIGGRFSALSPFCLVPAALKGAPVGRLLEAAIAMSERCREAVDPGRNPGALLGAVLGVLGRAGRDKLTIILPPRFRAFGLWLEQLIAESTGKDGRGILPVIGEADGARTEIADDRLYVHLGTAAEARNDGRLRRALAAGAPVVRIAWNGPAALGGQFFLWEFATAVAGHFLEINPFDQPDVESAKKRSREALAVYRATGALPPERPRFRKNGIGIHLDREAATAAEGLAQFLDGAARGGYVAIQAFIAPGRSAEAALKALRNRLAARTGLPVTVGFGPRFLHSTGQLHKGDAGRGLFIQITAADARDAAIPEEPGSAVSALTFGVLKAAQARGDLEALRAAGRRVLRLELGIDAAAGLRRAVALFR